MGLAFDPSDNSITSIEYAAASISSQPFIPGNCQAPTNSPDNPDNGEVADRLSACAKLSPLASVVVGS